MEKITQLFALFETIYNVVNPLTQGEMQVCNVFALNVPIPGFAAWRYPHSGVPVAEPQPCSEPGCCWGPQEPGVQASVQQAGSSAVWRHWKGPAATEGD